MTGQRDAARALTPPPADSRVLRFTKATVTSLDPFTVDLADGTELAGVARLASCAAQVGDVVEVRVQGGDYLVVDTIGPSIATWTPTVDNGLTVGNGDWTGSQLSLVNGWCHFYLQFELGSTSAVTGDVRIDFPYTPRGTSRVANTFTGFLEDADGTDFLAAGYRFDSSAFRIVALGAPSQVDVDIISSTLPFTWATGDLITLGGSYPVA